jgi:hypothetical protein
MAARSTKSRRARCALPAIAVLAIGGACSSGSGGDSHAGSSTTQPATPTTIIRPTTTPPTVTTPTGPSVPVVRVPPTIDPTGRNDVTKSLQRFLSSVPREREILFRKGARYRVEGTLVLRNRHGMTIDGNGATVFATTRGQKDRAQFWIKGGTNVVFRDLRVRGANPDAGTDEAAYVPKLENQHGFRFESVDGAELDHVQVHDVYGDFVYIGQGEERIPSRNVWVHDSRFARNGRQGIAATSARNVILERNHLSQTRRSTFDFEPDTRHARVSNAFVLNNTVGKGRLLFVASHGQGPVNNVVISGNRLVGHSMTIDSLAPERSPRRSNWIVVDNVSDTPVQQRVMRFFRTDGLEVRGNRQPVARDEPAIVLDSVCGAHISGNQFGSSRIRQVTPVCDAPLTVPKPLAVPGRGKPRGRTTVPTLPTTPTTQGPSTSAAPSTPTTSLPATAPSSGGGFGLADWIFVALGACVLAAVVLMFRARRPR